MQARITCSIACLAAVACGLPGLAQDSPLSLYTSDVAVVIRLKEPDRTIENVAGLVDQIQPGMGPQVRQSTPMLGNVIANPTLTGVDQTRDWYAGVYLHQDAEPVVVFGIPAVSPEDLAGAVGEGMQTSVHGTWVLYTDGESIPSVADDKTAESLFSERARTTFDAGDASLFVNVSHVAQVYADQLEEGQEQALEALNNLRFLMPDDNAGMNFGPILEMYGGLAEGLFQGINDALSLTVTVNAGKEGIAIEELVEFRDGSVSSDFLAGMPTSSMDLMDQLPGDGVMYYGFSGGVAALTRWSLELSAGIFQDESEGEAFNELLKQIDELEFGSLVAGVRVGDVETGLLQVTGIAEAKPMEKVREFTRKSSQAMGGIDIDGFRQEVTVQENAEEYGAHQADVVTVKQTYDEDADPFGIQNRVQEALFGPAGMQTRLIYLEDKYLSTLGGGRQAMEGLLAAVESGKESSLAKARTGYMEQTNMLALIDIPTLVAEGLRAASKLEDLELPVTDQMVESLNLGRSYLGIAVGAEQNGLRCRTRIPAEQMVGIAKLGVLFMALQAQQF
jgi:hypothetical protein